MQFHAASLGEAVPRETFDAVVQSVFDSAVNLRLAHEDRLVTVLLSDHYELPQGIRIADKSVPLHLLRVDQRAAASRGILRFDSSPLSLDLRGAPVWRCRIRDLHLDRSAPATRAAWSEVWSLLNLQQRLRGTDLSAADLLEKDKGSMLTRKMRGPVVQLVKATEQLDLENSIQAADQMVGLGPGVTPAGDDILIGFLAALWSLAAQDRGALSFLRSFGDALMQIAIKTNEISRTYLYHATRGQFSSSLSNLADAIGRGSNVEPAARIAMQVGHSSGMDSVTGLLAGLRVWNFLSDLSLPVGEEPGM